MIITKTPFRVSLCGGGSDIADFYRENGGCVLSTTINRYMYIMVHPYFESDAISLKYSENEIVKSVDDIKHSIFKCVLKDMDIKGVEITSTADVPSGTGLGSSSSFTVGLLHTLYSYKGKFVSKACLAEEACKVEIEKLEAPIGKQDQYAAAFGGMNFITFRPDDTVSVEPIITSNATISCLEDNLVMYYTGITHNANKILSEQKSNISKSDKKSNLIQMCKLAHDMKKPIEENSIDNIGQILHESWMKKRELAGSISNVAIDEMYECAMKNGAITIAFVGYNSGKLKNIAKYCVHCNIDNMQITEDIHLILNHMMMYILSERNC